MKKLPSITHFKLSRRARLFVEEVYTSDWFEPHSSFLRLKSFWAPFLVVVIGFLILCWKVSATENLVWDLLDWNVRDMYDWFKIPLWWLALLIPVVGLFNANHKSEQTKESMRLTGEQNRFANYYKHVEEFAKHCNSIQDQFKDSDLKIFARKYHAVMYLEAKNGSFSANQPLIDKYYEDIITLIAVIRRVRAQRLDDPNNVRSELINLTVFVKMRLSQLEWYLNCKRIPTIAIDLEKGSLIVNLSGDDIQNINNFFFLQTVLVNVLEFDPMIKNKTYTILTELKEHFYALRADSALSKMEERKIGKLN